MRTCCAPDARNCAALTSEFAALTRAWAALASACAWVCALCISAAVRCSWSISYWRAYVAASSESAAATVAPLSLIVAPERSWLR